MYMMLDGTGQGTYLRIKGSQAKKKMLGAISLRVGMQVFRHPSLNGFPTVTQPFPPCSMHLEG